MNNTTLSSDEAKYQEARKKVKKIKGFYTHLLVYVIINAMLLVVNYKNNRDANENFWQWQTLNTIFFWGIGLTAHALSVFLPFYLIGKKWEDQKIKELMEKEKSSKWE